MALKRTSILFPAAFLMNLNLGLVNFTVIFYLKDVVGIGASAIGWFFAAGAGCYVASCLLLSRVQHKIPAPVSMFVSIILVMFSVAGMMRAETPAVVLIFYLVFSSAPSLYWPPLVGWFSQGLSSRELGKTVSSFNISWSTGALAGPLVGGVLVEINLLLPFFADIAIGIVMTALLLSGIMFVDDMKIRKDTDTEAEGGDDSVLLNGGKGTFLRFMGWIGVFSTYIVLGLLNNIFPLFVRDSLGFGESVAGNILFLRGLATAIGFFAAGKLVFWHFNGRLMLIVQFLTAALMLGLFFIKNIAGFYLLFILFGIFFAAAYSNGIFHGTAGAAQRGPRMALFEAFLTMGVMSGSVAGGYLYQNISINAAFIFCASVITAGFIVQLVFFTYARHNNLK